jgi:hypothetical protein
MALSDPPPDPEYVQFLHWREETATAPPDPHAPAEAQQFHLFQQFLQFQVWKGAQAEQAQAQQEQAQRDQEWQEQKRREQARRAQRQQDQQQQAPEQPQVARIQLVSALQSYANKRMRQRQSLATSPTPAPRPAPRVAAPRNRLAWAVGGVVVLVLGCVFVYTLQSGQASGVLPFAPPALPVAYEQYTDASDALHFIGVITNTTSSPVANLVVHATLYDSKNREDASEDSYLGDVSLAPGQRIGFDLRIGEPPLKWVRMDLQVEVRGATFQHVPGLRISDDVIAPQEGRGYVVRGIVHNDGPDDAYPATVFVTGYDARGRVVVVGDSDTTDRDGIDAGQSSPFAVNLNRRDITITHYETLVYARGK